MKVKPWIFAGAASVLLGSQVAAAQEPVSAYPSKPVTIVVVVTPGGAAEAETRIYARRLQESLGKPILYDFKPGGGGTVGYTAVSRAAPDGYTLLATTTAFTTVPALMTLSYDPIKDFAPVILLGRQPGLFVASPSLPVSNLQEYIAYARANPGKLNFATNGPGSTAHLVGAWINELTNTQTTFVHYKGAQGTTDLMSGNVHVGVSSLINFVSQVKGGKLKAIAVAGPSRVRELPDVRTAAEQGVNFEFPSWVGITVPAATPPAIVNRLNAEFLKIQKMPETLQELDRVGILPSGGSPADFGKMLVEQIERWRRLVKQTGIKLEAQ